MTKVESARQANELRTLRGQRTHDEWCRILGVPKRTYYRYEKGDRRAPEHLMKLARIKGRKRRA